MYALTQWVIGIAIAHAIWLLAYFTGSLILAGSRRELDAGPATLRIVLKSVAGITIYGFESVALGFAGLLSPLGMLLAIAFNALLAWRLARRRGGVRAVLDICLREAAASMRGPAPVLYAVMLVLSTQATFPDYSSDGLRFHLAYAYEWARAGHIFADHRFRFPYYAFNNEVLYAMMMACGAARYIAFLNWLSGALTVLGIYGLIATIDAPRQATRGRISQGAATFVSILLPLAAAIDPVMLRWGDTAMPDVSAGMLLLGGMAGVVLAIASEPGALAAAISCVAFLAGTKPSYLFFVPLLALAIVAIVRSRKESARTALIAIGALLILAAPWYVRNLVADGDPIPPVGHFALHETDPDFTPAEWNAILNDLRADRSPQWIETYPWRLFFDTQTAEFREYGVDAAVFALYAIVAAAPFYLLKSRKTFSETALAFVLAAVACGCAYLFLTSILARYALLIYPLITAAAGGLLLDVASRIPRGVWAAPAIAALCLIPSPGTADFYDRYDALNYDQLSAMLPDDRHALELLAGGYKEAEPVLDADWAATTRNAVLLVVVDLQYLVERSGAQPIGDWTGSGRYSDFIAAIDDRTLMRYLDRRNVGAIVLNRQSQILIAPEYDLMRRQLFEGGFVETAADPQYASFMRRSIENRSHQHESQIPNEGMR